MNEERRDTLAPVPGNLEAPSSAAPGKTAAPSPQAGPQDLVFVRRLLSGDEAAFSALIERYHGALLRLALVFVPSRAVAEEVVQETWLAVLERLAAFEGRSSLKTWIFRILTNRAKTRGARERRFVPLPPATDPESERESAVDAARFGPSGMWADPPRWWDDDTPEKVLMRREALAQLERAIGELPTTQRAVVSLRDVQGLSSNEVCNILEISETNQRVLLHRARSKLRRALEGYVDRS